MKSSFVKNSQSFLDGVPLVIASIGTSIRHKSSLSESALGSYSRIFQGGFFARSFSIQAHIIQPDLEAKKQAILTMAKKEGKVLFVSPQYKEQWVYITQIQLNENINTAGMVSLNLNISQPVEDWGLFSKELSLSDSNKNLQYFVKGLFQNEIQREFGNFRGSLAVFEKKKEKEEKSQEKGQTFLKQKEKTGAKQTDSKPWMILWIQHLLKWIEDMKIQNQEELKKEIHAFIFWHEMGLPQASLRKWIELELRAFLALDLNQFDSFDEKTGVMLESFWHETKGFFFESWESKEDRSIFLIPLFRMGFWLSESQRLLKPKKFDDIRESWRNRVLGLMNLLEENLRQLLGELIFLTLMLTEISNALSIELKDGVPLQILSQDLSLSESELLRLNSFQNPFCWNGVIHVS